jgi:hypothetical protein
MRNEFIEKWHGREVELAAIHVLHESKADSASALVCGVEKISS